jgi:hypothetical protein
MKMTSLASKYKAFSTCGFHICVVFFVFWHRNCFLPQFYCGSFFPEKQNCLSDVHCGDPNVEPLHRQPEEQGCERSSGKTTLQSIFLS